MPDRRPSSTSSARQERLAEALRANLQRRKTQARARQAGSADDDVCGAGEPEPGGSTERDPGR